MTLATRRSAPSLEDAWKELLEAARAVDEELAIWEPTEKSRARLYNALLDVDRWVADHNTKSRPE